MSLGLFQLMYGYMPRAMFPSRAQVFGLAPYGGVAITGLLFMIQEPAFQWIGEQISPPKEEAK
ncbi:hypothetical protein FOA52_005893 [Chlamydomonas sp. UWO 241]|nr:hypothetical protein FOA52_005893 [Chlamydomonas sp. UWO 241]